MASKIYVPVDGTVFKNVENGVAIYVSEYIAKLNGTIEGGVPSFALCCGWKSS